MTSGISPTLLMNEILMHKNMNAEEVFTLDFGRSPFPVPEVLKSGLIENAENARYLSITWLPLVRKSVAVHHIHKSHSIDTQISIPYGVTLLPGSSFDKDTNVLSALLAYVDFNRKNALDKIDDYTDGPSFVHDVCPNMVKSVHQIKNFLNF